MRRAYRLLLLVFPRWFRRRYGDEMTVFFEDAWAEARGFGRVRLAARTIRDAVVQGVLERVRGLAPHKLGRDLMSGWIQDLRFAYRSLRRRPGFALISVMTLALGIGSASAVFSVVDTVAMRPVPYPQAERLVSLWTEFDDMGDEAFGTSLAETYDYAQETRAFEVMGSFMSGGATLTGVGPARRVAVVWTWGDLFGVTGIRTELGRLPGPADSRGDAQAVAVVTHEFWTSALAGDLEVVGRTVELDGRLVEIVGVLEASARLPVSSGSIWMPIARNRADIVDRSGHNLDVIARLAPGATMASVHAEIDEVHQRWHEEYAGVHSPGHPGHRFSAAPLHERYFGSLRPMGVLLLTSVLLVLLLACANVASLQLARGEGRAGELTVRKALGAGRTRLVRQLMVESLLLSAVGGALGLLMAVWGTGALMGLEPGDLPRVDAIGLDGRVTGFAVAATVLSGLLFGILPALRGASASIVPRAGSGRGGVGPDRSLSRSLSTLVVGQLALAVVLLGGAGLLVQSLGSLARAETGLTSRDRLTVQLSIPQARYRELPDIVGFWDRLVSEIEAVPGVEEAAVVRRLPLRDPVRRESMRIEGRVSESERGTDPIVYQAVTPGYFQVLEIPLLEGRTLEDGDGLEAARVAVVNEAAASAYWPQGSPVGSQVQPMFSHPDLGLVTVVGVVADVRAEGARTEVMPELYLPYAQIPPNGRSNARAGTVVVRALGDTRLLREPIRQAVERVDPQVPVSQVATLDQVAAESRARERFLATVMAVFALLAMAIAAAGTYGVVAFAAARRTREFGVRIALGAPRGRLVMGVVRGSVGLALLGAGIGAVAAVVGAPVLEGFIFGIQVRNPLSILLGPVVVTLVVILAAVPPALKASRADPVESLRREV